MTNPIDTSRAEIDGLKASYKAACNDFESLALLSDGLIEKIHSLKAALTTAKEALKFYGDEVLAYSITQMNEPRSAVHCDNGKKAREALAIIAKVGV